MHECPICAKKDNGDLDGWISIEVEKHEAPDKHGCGGGEHMLFTGKVCCTICAIEAMRRATMRYGSDNA
jgi:hypothetical protein